jgi:DNA-binding NarL/FixJ family response regulator
VPAPIDIVLADDHTMVRRGLRMVLDAEDGLEVAAEAGDVEEALRLTRAHRPAVVVLDLNMPGTATLPAIPRFVEAAPGCAVVVLTMEGDANMARTALAAGASAYILKEGAETELVAAVRAAAAGRTYLDPELGARIASSPEDSIRVGSTFAGHRIDAVAGTGGMGVVYRATDLALDRPVALKLVAPALAADPVFRTRFQRECRLAAGLDHPHVVPVFHAGEEGGRLYVTMRLVEGTDLRALLQEQGALEPRRAVGLIAQIADALDEAHAHGLVHRDVKPANILIRERNGSEHAYLTDFGVSKHRQGDPELTGTGLAIGTADYIAPEQAQGRDVDGRADVYSLACVLFQALTGQIPFEGGSDIDKLWAHVHTAPPDLHAIRPDLPAGLAAALTTALGKDPDDRHPSAGAFARDALAAI